MPYLDALFDIARQYPRETILALVVAMQWINSNRRLSECEDAHLVRDQIQLDLVMLNSEQAGQFELLGSSRRAVDKQLAERGNEFRQRADAIAEKIKGLNDEMLLRRKRQRDWLMRWVPRMPAGGKTHG